MVEYLNLHFILLVWSRELSYVFECNKFLCHCLGFVSTNTILNCYWMILISIGYLFYASWVARLCIPNTRSKVNPLILIYLKLKQTLKELRVIGINLNKNINLADNMVVLLTVVIAATHALCSTLQVWIMILPPRL